MCHLAETINTGKPLTCLSCGTKAKFAVVALGGDHVAYYIGTKCLCGVYTRETDLLPTLEEAQKELNSLTTIGDCATLRRMENEFRPPCVRRDH